MEQQQESDTPTEVLQLLLQQPALCSSSANTSAVIKLLAVSNATCSAVSNACAGRLSVSFTSRHPERSIYAPGSIDTRAKKEDSFAAWLSKHGHLLGSLHVGDTLLTFNKKLAAALRTAATASPNGLQLRSFDSDWDDTNGIEVLKQLPANHLTHLRMCITERLDMGDMWGMGYDFECTCEYGEFVDDCPCRVDMEFQMFEAEEEERFRIWRKHDNKRTVKVLASLTSLSSLSIHGYERLLTNSPVLLSLSKLTAVTKFSINEVLPNYSLLKHLPPQLEELELLGVVRDKTSYLYRPEGDMLDLRAFTSLTRLHAAAATIGEFKTLTDGTVRDVLPPNLASLCVSKIEGPLQLLIDLKSLRKLTLAQLPLLSQLPGNTTSTGTTSNSSNGPTATMGQVQACLPDVVIELVEPDA